MQSARYGLTTQKQIDEMRQELDKVDTADYRRRHTIRKIVAGIGNVFIALLVTVMLLTAYQIQMVKSTGSIPMLMGYSVHNVTTGSMIPTFEIGTIFLAKQFTGGALSSGTIVVFHDKGYDMPIAHRIVDVLYDKEGKLCYHTKGDNPDNSVDPNPLYPDQIIAVYVLKLPYLGW